ncbi:DUF3142 domain-containing protein [Serratia sp. Tan611]|uniref:DUF3142 domain-containing protein n=1 Tax=Serratia sp. Tan611 TaxID=2773264 RepID=UPI00193203B2|nr:DUF3142 domain-containing protein [Serratia sp. Tan611]CAE1141225.1 conserved protein of unknown function [Serratia sp. Tan611]
MKRWAAALLLVLLAFGAWLAGRHQALSAPPVWDQQVYLWQRVWSTQHAQALAASRDLFSSLRILALQLHPREGLRVMPVDTALLKQDGRPLWLVARLDGSQPRWDEERLYSRLLQLVQQYRAAGLSVVGIEIDHDAATARLPQYRDALRRLRRQLPADVQLSITALPAWLDSPQLPALLRQVDSSVLQLHAVLSPQQGLFDSRLALRWTQRYAQVTNKPFRIALPAYGMGLVGVDAQGAQVESEASLRVAGSLRELTVAPQHIADFLQRLSAHPQPHLRGVVWFRLPLAGDRRAWSMNTLRRVIRQQPLHSRWQVKMRPQPQQNGLYDLIIANDGPADAPLPTAVTLAAGDCLAADAVGRYRLDATATQLRFIRTGDELVRAGQSRPLGWLRCQHLTPGGIRVTP